ncbi:MAG TPA: alpha/beta hydrolase [Acidimicrobiales bacterium]|nr:alpha/beta hydrolase [Acidimicrobiales bacterium]
MNRLLLVHGFGGSPDDFAEWLPRFQSTGWEARTVRLPGHGTVDPPYSLERFTDVVLDTDWDRFVLLGHSMGGMVAQLAALREPERLAGLILMDTGHGPVDVPPADVELGKAVVRGGGMAALAEAQRGSPGTPAHERLLRERPGYAEFMEAQALAMDPEMWVALLEDMVGQADRLDGLRSLEVATLVVVGEQDSMFLGPSERMAAAMPHARLVVIPDAGHAPQFEAPDAWWRAVTAYLKEVS